MNCEDLLVLLESDDPANRDRAAAHATECPSCAVAAEQWAAVRSELAATSIPPETTRALWSTVVREERTAEPTTVRTDASRPERRSGFAALLVAALAVLVAVLAWQNVQRFGANDDDAIAEVDDDPGSYVAIEDEPQTVVMTIDPRPQLESLLVDIGVLRDELEHIDESTRRRLALREIDQRLAKYESWE